MLIKTISKFFDGYFENLKMNMKIELNELWTLCGYYQNKFNEGPSDDVIIFRDKNLNCRDFRNRVRYFTFVQCDL